VVDPGGNWLRIFPDADASAPASPRSAGKPARALDNAVVLADSRGDPAQAAKILDGALARASDAGTV
jgi:hypothetical protein